MVGQPGFFDLDERYRALAESGDPLIRLAELIEFEVFRRPLLTALTRSDGSRGGRPPYDPVLMFKILVLQMGARDRRKEKDGCPLHGRSSRARGTVLSRHPRLAMLAP